MPITIDGTGTITGATTLASTVASPTFTTPALGTPASGILTSCTGVPFDGFKNRIINGAMVIDQRNAGASVTPANDAYMTDRWKYGSSQASKFTAQQVSTAPTGFINSLKMTVASAVTIGAGDYFTVYQPIEGLNVSDLAWGTASAATVNLSFWVYSSLTGTFGGSLRNSTGARSYPFTYTILAASTWEQKTVTITGDTTGTWLTTNGIGIYVGFGLGIGATYSGTAGAWAAANNLSATGAVSVVGTASAVWYVTGVQLEKGSTASSFDYRSIGTELALCQRYYFQKATGDTIYFIPCPYNLTGGNQWLSYFLPEVMRAVPTVTSGSWVGGAPSATYPGYRSIAFNFGASTNYMGDATTLTVSAEL